MIVSLLLSREVSKDSIACFLHLMESMHLSRFNGVVEIHHHDIDGMDGKSFMDWPCTPSYCDAFAKAYNMPIYHSWRHGGFKREMLRENALTAPVSFETPEGRLGTAGGVRGKQNTRRKFPQVSANLQVRWCSASLKIDVMDMLINNQERFQHGKTLVITGERAQESAARAHYATFEPHRADRRDGKRVKRYIDHWRPIHAWPEEEVWEIIERHKILMHPAYRLGWGRLSCMTCIFGSPAQWASVKAIDPERFEYLEKLEREFDCTIHRTKTLAERIQGAKPYVDMNPLLIAQSLDEGYEAPIFVNDWKLPAGAFGESAGPT
jgi:3'-phosphoadenosine 5'-phosphosulfate sulfotransferase (PAPS reductase)/FAD synthetase